MSTSHANQIQCMSACVGSSENKALRGKLLSIITTRAHKRPVCNRTPTTKKLQQQCKCHRECEPPLSPHVTLSALSFPSYLCKTNSVHHPASIISISILVAVFTPWQIIQRPNTAINKATSEAMKKWVRKKGFVLSFITLAREVDLCIF